MNASLYLCLHVRASVFMVLQKGQTENISTMFATMVQLICTHIVIVVLTKSCLWTQQCVCCT